MICIGAKKSKIYVGSKKVKKIYIGATKTYSAGNWVTYIVDSNTSYSEEVDEGLSILSPSTFTPTKSGWSFVGWRFDTTANGSVISSQTMGDDPITLYAVFSQTVTGTFSSYSSTKTVKGTRYYNTGNITNATIATPTGASYSGWDWRGWSSNNSTSATAEVWKATGNTITDVTGNFTCYGLYQQIVTCTFKSYNSNQTARGIRYYNAYGNTSNASITVPNGAAYNGWSWRGWSASGNAGATASVAYSSGNTISNLSSNHTYYGLYQQTITLSYNGNGATSGSVGNQTGTRYHNSAGNYSNPSFTLASNGFARSGYTFNGWNLGAVGATITLSANATAYAQWVGTPYYPTFTDSSLWTQVGTIDNAATPFKAHDSYVEVCAQDNEQMTDFSYSTYQATFNTQGCNKVRLYVEEESGDRGVGSGEVRVISNSGTISQGITTEGKHYLYFDMSGDTFTVQLSVGNASSYYEIDVMLYEIYAYCE